MILDELDEIASLHASMAGHEAGRQQVAERKMGALADGMVAQHMQALNGILC